MISENNIQKNLTTNYGNVVARVKKNLRSKRPVHEGQNRLFVLEDLVKLDSIHQDKVLLAIRAAFSFEEEYYDIVFGERKDLALPELDVLYTIPLLICPSESDGFDRIISSLFRNPDYTRFFVNSYGSHEMPKLYETSPKDDTHIRGYKGIQIVGAKYYTTEVKKIRNLLSPDTLKMITETCI